MVYVVEIYTVRIGFILILEYCTQGFKISFDHGCVFATFHFQHKSLNNKCTMDKEEVLLWYWRSMDFFLIQIAQCIFY